MGTHWIPERSWSRRRRSSSEPKVGEIATRADGYQRARKVWLCLSCRGWNETGERKTPPACRFCSYATLLRCDSAGEAKHFGWLWQQQDRGVITGLDHHPRYDLLAIGPTGQPKRIATYEADSQYVRTSSQEIVIEDFKPRDPVAQDPVFKIKRKWFEHQTGLRVTIVTE